MKLPDVEGLRSIWEGIRDWFLDLEVDDPEDSSSAHSQGHADTSSSTSYGEALRPKWAPRLSDFLIPVLAYVRMFEQNPQGSSEELSARLNEMIEEAKRASILGGIQPEAFEVGLFGVVAWVDERIALLKQWESVHSWQDYLLQRRYFNTVMAGVEFYDFLAKIAPWNNQVREIYILCLEFGFVGKYTQRNSAAELAALKSAQLKIYKDLEGFPEDVKKLRLAPGGYQAPGVPLPAQVPYWKRLVSPKLIAVVLIPPLIFLILIVVLDSQIDHAVFAFRKSIEL